MADEGMIEKNLMNDIAIKIEKNETDIFNLIQFLNKYGEYVSTVWYDGKNIKISKIFKDLKNIEKEINKIDIKIRNNKYKKSDIIDLEKYFKKISGYC